jgi:outer membrane autotransporter protein
VNYKIKVNNMFGLYAKPQAQITDELKVYGKVGFTRLSVKDSLYNRSSSGTGASYGVGVSYKFSDDMAAYLEYMSYYNRKAADFNGKIKIQGVNLGVEARF